MASTNRREFLFVFTRRNGIHTIATHQVRVPKFPVTERMRGRAVATNAPMAQPIAKVAPVPRTPVSLEDKRCNFGLGPLSKTLEYVALESGAVSRPGRPSTLERFCRIQYALRPFGLISVETVARSCDSFMSDDRRS